MDDSWVVHERRNLVLPPHTGEYGYYADDAGGGVDEDVGRISDCSAGRHKCPALEVGEVERFISLEKLARGDPSFAFVFFCYAIEVFEVGGSEL